MIELTILHAHSRTAPAPWRSRIIDQLAQCAMHGGGDWATQLNDALAAHKEANAQFEIAQTHKRLGEMLLLQGAFADADKHFLAADHLYSTLADAGKTARVGALRSRLALRAGRVEQALERIDEALQRLGDREPRVRAFARLERARIQACRGRSDDAARELMQAEGVLGVSGNAADRLQTRLARAEALIVLGDIPRAIKGLRRLLVEATSVEDVATRALVHALFGQATLDDDPTQSRRHLMRAHHLYQQIAAEYQLAFCELLLARVDHRLGLNPRSRLKALVQRPLGRWPLLRAELAIARAEIYGKEHPERAREGIMQARAFATRNGHMSLARILDAVLVTQGLVSNSELDELTPVDPQPMVIEAGSSYSAEQLTFASVASPMPFIIDELPPRLYDDAFATRIIARPERKVDAPKADTVLGPRPLDISETLAHANAGDALQALELLLPAANDDADEPRTLIETPMQPGSLVSFRAARSRADDRPQ